MRSKNWKKMWSKTVLNQGGSVVSGQAHCRMGWWQRPALTCYQKDAKWVGGQNFRVFLIVAYFTYTITLHFLYFIEVNSNDSLQTTELNTLMWYKASKTSHILYFNNKVPWFYKIQSIEIFILMFIFLFYWYLFSCLGVQCTVQLWGKKGGRISSYTWSPSLLFQHNNTFLVQY